MEIKNLSELTQHEMQQLMQRGVFDKLQIVEAVELIEKFRDGKGMEQKVAKVPVVPSAGVFPNEQFMAESYRRLLGLGKFQLEQFKGIEFLQDGRRTRVEVYPYKRVGAYVPSGLPSTLLTIAANAQAAGVEEMVICTKPDKEKGISPEFMAAADIAGIKYIYTVPSARLAIPMLGFGTPELDRVEKIVGPCSPFVDVVKQLMPLYGVAVDMRANSSELIVIADYNEKQVALDMLAQAEHHLKSESSNQKKFIALAPNMEFAQKLYSQIQEQGNSLPDYIRQSIEGLGEILVAGYNDAAKFANQYYPEVLELWLNNKQQTQEMLSSLRCGKIYVNTPATVGDYGFVGSGCNDPTGGTNMPGINVLTYMNRREVNSISAKELEMVRPKVAQFARLEGLVAHAASVKL